MSLNEAFSFTQEDLAANTAGRITEKQSRRLQEIRRSSLKGHVMGGAAALSTVLLLTGVAMKTGGPDSTRFFFTALTAGIFFLLYGFFAVLALFRTWDTRTGKVSAAEGKLEVKRAKNRYGTIFTAKVGGVGFRLLDKAEFDSLKDHSYCRIYYVKNPPVHFILSVEPTG